jgi:sugar diacid utilization regulator/putative methionine-R-sulfoxide reductase with GAF domain
MSAEDRQPVWVWSVTGNTGSPAGGRLSPPRTERSGVKEGALPLSAHPPRVQLPAHPRPVEPWLQSALELAVRAVDARGCAVIWRVASGESNVAGVGSFDGLEPHLSDGSVNGLSGAWTTPLTDAAGEPFGLLAADDPEPARLRALDDAAEHIGLLLASNERDVERTAAYEALIEVTSQIHAQELNSDEILGLIVRQARHLMGVDVTWLALVDEERDRVVVKVASGATTEDFVRMWVQVGKGVGGLAIRDRRPVVVRDHRTYDHPTTELVRRTLAAEGVVSLLAAPMIFGGKPVGALYGGSRTPTEFSETAVSMFTALAGQAAVSIANSMLYRDLESKNHILERTFALHETLNRAALTGEGMDSIARQLVLLVGCEVVVVRAAGTPRARSYSCDDPASEPVELSVEDAELLLESEHSFPIVAGEEKLGTISVPAAGELTALQRNALQQATTVMALEMMKERAALEAEWRLRGELLEEILQADGKWSEGLVVRSERFGVDLEAERCLAVIEPLAPRDVRDLEFVVRVAFHRDLGDGSALLATRGERLLVALTQDAEAATEALRVLLEKADRSGISAIAGISTPRRNLAVALMEAQAATGLAREAGAGGIVSHDSLGPLRFLLDAPNTDQMLAIVRDSLGPVAEHDRKRGGGGLLETLRVDLAAGGNRAAVADRCHIHISTVKYRIRKVAELLGVSLSDPRTRFELSLAFEVLDVLKMLGTDALDAPCD